MYCTNCGAELKSDARYCSGCGTPTALAQPKVAPSRPLMLDKRNKKIAGVCAGFARYFERETTLFRVLWVLVALCGGVGFLGYVAAWIIIPSDHGNDPRFVMEPNRQAG